MQADFTPEMVKAMICREMGWTWSDFEDQPQYFITCVLAMFRAEGKVNASKRSQ